MGPSLDPKSEFQSSDSFVRIEENQTNYTAPGLATSSVKIGDRILLGWTVSGLSDRIIPVRVRVWSRQPAESRTWSEPSASSSCGGDRDPGTRPVAVV